MKLNILKNRFRGIDNYKDLDGMVLTTTKPTGSFSTHSITVSGIEPYPDKRYNIDEYRAMKKKERRNKVIDELLNENED